MSKIKSVSILPVNQQTLSALYGDNQNGYWKTPLLAIAVVHVIDNERNHFIRLIPLDITDLDRGTVALDDDGEKIDIEEPLHVVLEEHGYTKELTPDELESLGLTNVQVKSVDTETKSEVDYQKEAESILRDILYEPGMTVDELEEAIAFFRKSKGPMSVQQLANDLAEGVKNGHSIDEQKEIAKAVMNSFGDVKKRAIP